MARLIPSLDQFTNEELLENLKSKPDKKTLRKIKDFTYTVSYAILAELQKRAKAGDKIAVNTLYYDKQSTKDYFKFILILSILEKQNKQVKEVEEKQDKERKVYSVRYYLNDQGEPVLLDPIAEPESKLNSSTRAMFG